MTWAMRSFIFVLLSLIVLSLSVRPVEKVQSRPVLVVQGSNANKVHIVGVSHGSLSSSLLVDEVIRRVNPKAVVLELCEERFISIAVDTKVSPVGNGALSLLYDQKRAEIERKRAKKPKGSSQQSVYNGLIASLKFAQGQGLVGGAFVCLGLMVTSLQSVARSWAMRDSSPPSAIDDEFTTALRVSSSLGIPLRLADAPQNQTLQSLQRILAPQTFIPSDVFSAFKLLCFSAFGKLPRASNERLSRSIPSSVLLSSEWIDIPRVYSEDEDMLRSLYPILTLLPLTLALQFLPAANYEENMASLRESVSTLAPAADAFLTAHNINIEALLDTTSFVSDILYFLLLIRMTKLIGADRDIIIASNIKTVCDEFEGADIVVVVGMLHSNGVARYLLSGVDPADFKTE